MSNPVREIEYNGFDGLWKLDVKYDAILVIKDSEHRIYDLDDITKVEHDTEYVWLYKYGGGFYQVKFEVGNFLVIDEFDSNDEFVGSVGSHVFGEEN
jgi:hypothetical protein